MSEIKEKKIRIVKFAADCNVSADTIIDFLRKKGFDAKTPNSPLSDEMLTALESHFKKDLEKAHKQHVKVSEFHKKLNEKTGREPKLEVVEEIKPEPIEVQVETPVEEPVSEPVIEEVMVEPEPEKLPEPIIQQQSEVIPEPVEPEIIESVQPEEEQEEVIEIEASVEEIKNEVTEVEPEPVDVHAEVVDDLEASDDETEEESDIKQPEQFKTTYTDSRKRKGLKIVGRMDLSERKATPPKPAEPVKEQPEQNQQKTPNQTNESPQVVKVSINPTDAEGRAKKKKKKPRGVKGKEPKIEETEAQKKRAKVKKIEIDEKEVRESIRRTLSVDDTGVSSRAALRKKKRERMALQEERIQEMKRAEKNTITVTEFMAVNELANLMEVGVAEVISKCIGLGLMVSINQRLEMETITLVADEFGFEVQVANEYTSDSLEDYEDLDEELVYRSPVVTIMGHVDHGKTSLLDYVRRANVVAGESGGITQHIGAYKVEVEPGKFITFLDTPGHEAFTAMRARGAQVTDIVVLIVAADDAVMPQTVEAISHALAANVPIIVAINKIDKPGSNIDKIKQQLADRNVLVEDWGGRYQCVEISAKTGKNVDLLLEKILLEAEVLDLKANPDRNARGVVIESQLDKGRGVVATILVQKGTLETGDPFICGVFHGRVRAMFDERNKRVQSAEPATPVLVLGLESAPQAGDLFIVVESEREAREIAVKRQQLKREQDNKQVRHITLDEISRQISIGGVKELAIIVKGDVDGSVEALSDSLMKLSTGEVIVRVIHRGVGAISESDVLLANASQAIIIGFHVRPNLNAKRLSETLSVDIRLYSIIYDAINQVKSALEGMLSPIISEETKSSVEVREIYKVPKVGTVAGCYVLDGKIARNERIRVVRDGIVVFTGEILALKRFKDDVKEVDQNYECGISVNNFNDIKVGDIIESFKVVETKKKLT